MIDKNISLLKLEFDELKVNSSYGLYLRQGILLSENQHCILYTQSKEKLKFLVYDDTLDHEVWINFENKLEMSCDCNNELVCKHKIASLIQSIDILEKEKSFKNINGYRYTKSGMIDRVLKERLKKAVVAKYIVEYADNKFGEHVVINEKETQYRITIRSFEKEMGYCTCPDYSTNKLGTCKHLMFVFRDLRTNSGLLDHKLEVFPFVEVYLNPSNNNRISWYYPGRIQPIEISELLFKYFGNSVFLSDEKVISFLGFIQESSKHDQIKIREEVYIKVENAYENNMLDQIKTSSSIDFGLINETLPDYQKEFVEFATFKAGVVLADEFGLDNQYQAVVTAIFKKEIIGFKNCLIICPTDFVSLWKSKINNLSDEKVVNITGSAE